MKIKKLPIKFYRLSDNGKLIFVAENKSMNILCWGDTLIGLFEELDEYLNDIWKAYALEDDNKLEEHAIELKKKLLEYNIHD